MKATRSLWIMIPAQAGIHRASKCAAEPWIPAFAGIAAEYSTGNCWIKGWETAGAAARYTSRSRANLAFFWM